MLGSLQEHLGNAVDSDVNAVKDLWPDSPLVNVGCHQHKPRDKSPVGEMLPTKEDVALQSCHSIFYF